MEVITRKKTDKEIRLEMKLDKQTVCKEIVGKRKNTITSNYVRTLHNIFLKLNTRKVNNFTALLYTKGRKKISDNLSLLKSLYYLSW